MYNIDAQGADFSNGSNVCDQKLINDSEKLLHVLLPG